MRNPLRVRFVRHVAMTGGAQFLQALFAMIAGIVVARALGASARGVLSVLTALGAMAVLLASFGVHLSGIYFMGRYKDSQQTIVSNNLLVGVLGGLITGAALAAVGLVFHSALLQGIDTSLFLVFVISVPFAYFSAFGRQLLLGGGHVAAYTVPDALGGIALLVGTVVAIAGFGHELLPQVLTRVLVEVAVAVVTILLLRRLIRFRFAPSRPMLRRQLRYGLRNYTGSLMWLLLLQSDVVLCNHFLGTGPTGVYSAAVALGLPVTMLAGVVGTLTFQRVSSEADRATRISQTNRAVRTLLPLVLGSVILAALLANTFVPLIYGAQFADAANALILLLPGLMVYSLELVLMNFLAGEGTPPVVIWAPAAGLVANFTANLFVIPRWGINGASVTSSLGYTLVLVLVARYYMRSTGSTLRDIFGTRPADLAALLGPPRAKKPSVDATG